MPPTTPSPPTSTWRDAGTVNGPLLFAAYRLFYCFSMPRKNVGGTPVTSLMLEEPESSDPDLLSSPAATTDDPLRDPLLPVRERDNDQHHWEALSSSPPPTKTTTSSAVVPQNLSLRTRLRQSRVLDRDAAFHQSRGRWRVHNLSREAVRFRYNTATGQQRKLSLTKRLWDDWFYNLAYQRTIILIFILFFAYGAIVVVFAFLYLGVSILGEQEKLNPDGTTSKLPFCDMDIHDHMEALYFSLSTMTTIGYGVSDYYFGGCWTPLLMVLAQVCTAITFDAVAIGLIFQRISRGHKRGKTIMFSDRAAVQRVQGKLYLMFRMGELRHHQLREASVKAYCIRHERIAISAEDVQTTHFVTRPLPLLHEKTSGGGSTSVLMSLPQVLVHCLDDNSPLVPPPQWYDEEGIQHTSCRYTQSDASVDEQQRQPDVHGAESIWALETAETSAFLRDRQAEIVILVEGTDELTGASIQARMSYTVHDLAWNHTLLPCIFPYQEDRLDSVGQHQRQRQSAQSTTTWCRKRTPPTCVVDFNAFHDMVPVADNVDASPYVYNMV